MKVEEMGSCVNTIIDGSQLCSLLERATELGVSVTLPGEQTTLTGKPLDSDEVRVVVTSKGPLPRGLFGGK